MNDKFSILINKKLKKYNKKITVDPDKSITHRCYIIASQCLGISKIKGLYSEDVKATINALKKLEYRGYDSAGLATIANGEINEKKCIEY